MYFAMAQEGLAFRWMGALHPRFHTPHLATITQAVWASSLVATGTYRELFTRVIYTEWFFFALMTVGLLRLRRRSSHVSPLRGTGALVPLLFIAGSLTVVCCQIAADPAHAASGLVLVVLGWPVYLVWVRRGAPRRFGARANH